MKTLSKNHRKHTLIKLLGMMLLALGMIGEVQTAEAKLDPFYIVSGSSFTTGAPRILFLLDSSGSMAQTLEHYPNQGTKNRRCLWHQCEDDDAGIKQSRINAARNVIADLAAANHDKAEFSLMTFGNAPPPDDSEYLKEPERCTATAETANISPLSEGDEVRFTWIELYVNDEPGDDPGDYQTDVLNPWGTQGMWALCGDNLPFPYLRHDDLGAFSMPNNSNAPLPDTPLYLVESTEADYRSPVNYTRQVQFFPRWIGRRGNLDCNDPHQEGIVLRTMGDYGNTDAEKLANICGHDFYYWPYVDGFAGYSEYSALNREEVDHSEGQENGKGTEDFDGDDEEGLIRLGIARHDWKTDAALYAPFYSAATIADNNVPIDEKGPFSLDNAWMMFDAITSKSFMGGSDASGGTPLADAIGEVDDFVEFDDDYNMGDLEDDMEWSNEPFAHRSAASYLTFLRVVEDQTVCRPLSLVVVSDGIPSPWSSQGSKAYERLPLIRRVLGVPTYMVAFTQEVYAVDQNRERINNLACAAAGGGNVDEDEPCEGDNDIGNWDTCADPSDPVDGCAWLTADPDELKVVLSQIINQTLDTDVPGGAPTVANDFQLSDPQDPNAGQAALQTSIDGWTETPEWIGHVARQACDDPDPDDPNILAEYCQAVIDEPLITDEVETFGPCPLSRTWDAGECLQLTSWSDRRIYTHDFDNNVFRIADANGEPTAEFIGVVEALDNQGKIDPPLSNSQQDKTNEIIAMTEWLLGRGMPNDWKLSGLPNSAPILIRRVPEYNANFLPTVGIRDPHCAGRRNAAGDNIPPTLEQFSNAAQQLTSGGGLQDHYDYTEAVLVGDDFGILHAFHYNSGNELFGFVPLALLNNSRRLSMGSAATYGQDPQLQSHVFGIASTVNAGWAWDDDDSTWRHLAVFGMGPGGNEIVTLDVSHMGRLQTDDPIEVVWTSSTTSIADDYAETLGQTWSRPALTYAVRSDSMSLEPEAYMVFGSGYPEGAGGPERGRTVWAVDAMTGETVTQKALMEEPNPNDIYDLANDYAAISDVAVASHCLSRYWGEMQEAYWVDPAGRLFRWDLGVESSDVTAFPHTADGGGEWADGGDGFVTALESYRFPACQGVGSFNCSINASNKGDVFTFSPAVVANNRIDDVFNPDKTLPIGDRDQFLLALVSGSPNDDAIDGVIADNNFHSSLYLLVDDHRAPNEHAGFTIPPNAPAAAPGDYSAYMRLPLNNIERTRTIVYPNGDTEQETRVFSKAARPIRPPLIRVTGLADGQNQLDAEVFYITWTIYEPGTSACDARWRDPNTGEWLADPGATYEITMRLIVGDDGTFDFNNGYNLPGDHGDGFGSGGALSSPVVEQQVCEGANCGAVLRAPKTSPCDPNTDPPSIAGAISVQTGTAQVEGFSPLEIPL